MCSSTRQATSTRRSRKTSPRSFRTSDRRDADEVAWKTAVHAAPYLLNADAVEREVPPEELFDKLQSFKELVAEDIEAGGTDAGSDHSLRTG